MPGKGKYTTYNAKEKKSFLNDLFRGGPYNGLGAEETRERVVEMGNLQLRAGKTGGKTAGDLDMFPKGVDLTYSGRDLPYGPANGEVDTNDAGDPMNAFVPDTSSPGPGKTDGLDKDPSLNPKKSPEDYKLNVGGVYVPSANTRQPAKSTVYSKNVLGEDNKFDTTKVEQYPE
jgi:hypothetical protein